MHRRALLYAALALAVPLPALAITAHGGGDAGQPAPVDLQVSASLDSCGTAADTIVCKIDASWNSVPGATRYTANVTRADGTVVDFGDIGGTSESFWVPYAGNGTYTVSVSAYGTPPGADEEELVARDRADTGGSSHRSDAGTAEATVQEAAGGATTDSGDATVDDSEEAPEEDVTTEEPAPDEDCDGVPDSEDPEPSADEETPPEAEAASTPDAETESTEEDPASDGSTEEPAEPTDCVVEAEPEAE